MPNYKERRAAAQEEKCPKASRCKHGHKCPHAHEALADFLCFEKPNYDKMVESPKQRLRKLQNRDTLADISAMLHNVCNSDADICELGFIAGVGRCDIKRMHDGEYSDDITDLIAVVEAAGYKLQLVQIPKRGGGL